MTGNINNKEINEIHQKLENQKNSRLEKNKKRCQIFSDVSKCVAVASFVTIVGNVVGADFDIALQTAGTTVAMATYSISNSRLVKYYDKQIKESKELKVLDLNIIEIEELKEKLELYKSKLEFYKINHFSDVFAAIGFGETFIVALINSVQAANADDVRSLVPLAISTSLSGIVSVGHAILAKKSKSQIVDYEELIKNTNNEIKDEEAKILKLS